MPAKRRSRPNIWRGPTALRAPSAACAIFRCPGFNRLHDKGEFYRFIVIRPEGTYATIVAIDGRDRFRFSIVGSEEKRSFSEEEVRAAIVTAFGKAFDFEILSIMPWVRRELVADRFASGRVFIA